MLLAVNVPKLNENDDTVLILDLCVPEGGRVQKDQPLFVVETSKAAVEVPAEQEGYLHWLVKEGQTVPMRSTIAFIGETIEELQDSETVSGSFLASIPVACHDSPEERNDGPRATRAARELATKLGVQLDLINVPGIIRERDVQKFAARTYKTGITLTSGPLGVQKGIVSMTSSVDFPGKIDTEFLCHIRRHATEFGELPSDFKVWLYRKHGARIGENIRLGKGTVLDAQFIEIGDDTFLEDGIQVRCCRFSIGQLCRIGSNCRFFCHDFIAGDVVTIRWNAAVVDGQGGVGNCRIGDLSFIGYDTYLNTDRDLLLGERVCLSPGVRVYTHRKWLEATDGHPFAYAPVVIGNRSWLGPSSVVLPGVTLSDEVTVMANSVVASNAPPGVLVGGSPAAIVLKQQKAELSDDRRGCIVVEILQGNTESLGRKGWVVQAKSFDSCIWAGLYTNGESTAHVVVVEDGGRIPACVVPTDRLILIVYRHGDLVPPRPGLTVFDLETKRVQGTRDMAADIVRLLFHLYGIEFEPRLWRYGCRLHETTY